jgi:hypothetical protein
MRKLTREFARREHLGGAGGEWVGLVGVVVPTDKLKAGSKRSEQE